MVQGLIIAVLVIMNVMLMLRWQREREVAYRERGAVRWLALSLSNVTAAAYPEEYDEKGYGEDYFIDEAYRIVDG